MKTLLLIILSLFFTDQDWESRDWTEPEYKQELRRLLQAEGEVRSQIRKEAGELAEESDKLAAIEASKTAVFGELDRLERKVEAIESSFNHRKRHYVESATLTRETIKVLEDQVLSTAAKDRVPLFEQLESQRKYLAKLEKRIERLRENNGVTQKIEELQAEKEAPLQRLKEILDSLKRQETAVAHAQADVDREVERLDEAIEIRMKFERLATKLLSHVAPPILRSVQVKSLDGTEVFYDAKWTDAEERTDATEEALKLCESMMFEKRQHVRDADRSQVAAQLEFIGVDSELQFLYGEYESRVYQQGFANVGIELADSADTIFVGTGGNPALIAVAAVTELGFRLKEVAEYSFLDVKPSFRDFPEVSSDYVQQRKLIASQNRLLDEPVAAFSAANEFDRNRHFRTSPESIQSWLNSTTGKNVTTEALKSLIVETARGHDAKGKLSMIRAEARLLQELKRVPGSVNQQTILDSLQQLRAGRGEVVAKTRDYLRSVDFKKKIAGGLAKSVGKAVAKEVGKAFIDEGRHEIWARIMQKELEWFVARRQYHSAAARVRFERKWLEILRTVHERLQADMNHETSQRYLETAAMEQLPRGGSLQMQLVFDQPVEHVSFKASFLGDGWQENLTTEDGRCFLVDFSVDKGSAEHRSRLEVSGVATLTRKGLDADPLTPAYFDTSKRSWEFLENGTDKNHSLLLGEEAEGVSVVLLIDCSGSMAEDGRMERTKASVREVLADRNLVGPGDEVAIWNFFKGQPGLVCGFTRDHTIVAERISRLQPSGSTPLGSSTLAAGRYLLRHAMFERKVLLVLTDGTETHGSSYGVAKDTLEKENVEVEKWER